MKGATIVKYVYTASNGSYTLTDVNAGTYTVVVTKTGYTFPTSAPVTVGDSKTVNITGTKP